MATVFTMLGNRDMWLSLRVRSPSVRAPGRRAVRDGWTRNRASADRNGLATDSETDDRTFSATVTI